MMMRWVFRGAVSLLVVLGACTRDARPLHIDPVRSPTTSPSPSPSPSPPPTPIAFSVDEALHHVSVLAKEIGPRHSGDGEAKAAEYISSTFAAMGYQVEMQQFPRSSGGTSVNVIAKHPKADYSAGWVLVGGHYDTVPGSPGGNDNASGVGVTLALAQAFSDRAIPVQWIGFAREEVDHISKKHHEGSIAYAKSLSDIKQVKAVISIDMVGAGDRLVVVRDRKFPGSLRTEFVTLAGEMGVAVTERAMGDVSDHTTFTRRGVDGVLLWSGEHPTFHKATDTFEVVRPDAIQRTGSVVQEWLKRRFSV